MICQIHNAQMTQRESKTKLDDEGLPKKYFAHGFGETICFGTPTITKAEDKPAPVVHQVPTGGYEDPTAVGKTRCQVAVAFIGMGHDIEDETCRQKMNLWVDWIMNGS